MEILSHEKTNIARSNLKKANTAAQLINVRAKMGATSVGNQSADSKLHHSMSSEDNSINGLIKNTPERSLIKASMYTYHAKALKENGRTEELPRPIYFGWKIDTRLYGDQ